MSEMDLEAALDRFGTDWDRWPPTLAETAKARLVTDPMFRRAFEETAALEALLPQALHVPDPPLGYATRITARALETARIRRNPFDLRWLFAVGSGWAAAAAIAGVVYANVLAPSDPELLSFAEIALGTAQIVTGN